MARHERRVTAHLATLGSWVASVEEIPGRVRRAARLQILDMVAAAHASARSREMESVKQGLAAIGGAGRSTVLVTGAKLTPTDAALANAAYSMAHDFDDIVWMGHTCHSAVFAALAVAHRGRPALRARRGLAWMTTRR
jgi:2-methylcitrate dehydratase PrpD